MMNLNSIIRYKYRTLRRRCVGPYHDGPDAGHGAERVARPPPPPGSTIPLLSTAHHIVPRCIIPEECGFLCLISGGTEWRAARSAAARRASSLSRAAAASWYHHSSATRHLSGTVRRTVTYRWPYAGSVPRVARIGGHTLLSQCRMVRSGAQHHTVSQYRALQRGMIASA
eukprot:3463619-Rhodomonas_salina.2